MSDQSESVPPPPPRRPGSPWMVAVVSVLASLLVVTAGYVVGSSHASGADPAGSTVDPAVDPSQLGMLVSGSGSAVGVPDQLRFSVTVQHHEADVTTAIDETSTDVRKVVRALTGNGIDRKDVRTANVSVQPTYRYAGGQEQITGYSASERITVVVRELRTAGAVISATANAAGNAVRIGGIGMSVADPSTLLATARANAIADARTKAEQFAKAAGRSLGKVVVVEETQASQPDYDRPALLDATTATAGRVPIKPGTETEKVDVRVRWSFA